MYIVRNPLKFRNYLLDSVSNISYEIVTVDCKWSNWSECSASCGFAIQQRTVLKEAQNDGQQCQGKSLRYCRQEACSEPVPSKNFYIIFSDRNSRNKSTVICFFSTLSLE